MSDETYERDKIERMIRSPEHQLRRQETIHLRNTYCSAFSPMQRITEDVCESCNNYGTCSNIEEVDIIPKTLLELTL